MVCCFVLLLAVLGAAVGVSWAFVWCLVGARYPFAGVVWLGLLVFIYDYVALVCCMCLVAWLFLVIAVWWFVVCDYVPGLDLCWWLGFCFDACWDLRC